MKLGKLLLALLLCVSLIVSAAPVLVAGGETTGFADMEASAWYAPAVAQCAERGVMVGVGAGRFEPERTLNEPECLTLALRLYLLCRGEDGALEAAPEDWGRMVFVTADGTEIARYADEISWLVFGRAGGWYPALRLETEEALAWGRRLDGTEAGLHFAGESWPGTARFHSFRSDLNYLYWTFDRDAGPTEAQFLSMQQRFPGPSRWYRDAYWNAEHLGLTETPGFAELAQMTWLGSYNDPAYAENVQPPVCTRLNFACAVAAASGELEPLHPVEAIPDVPREDDPSMTPTQIEAVYKLYAAGILQGVDAQGSFAPQRSLTRSEAAAMVARVLDPEQSV